MADGFDKHFTRILLVAALGSIGVGAATAIGTHLGTGAATDELVKIRETLAVAVAKLEGHEQRLSNLEALFLRESE